MAKLLQTDTATKVEFVVSETLDLLNAMYFTRLVLDAHGIDDWPAQIRSELTPALRTDLDLLFSFPHGEPGVMGKLSEVLFAHRETWPSVDDLLRFVREMPPGIGDLPLSPGIQGLALYGSCASKPFPRPEIDLSVAPRESVAQAIQGTGGDVQTALALYDRPEEVRGRMLTIISTFYEDHYRAELPRRLPWLERSVAAHNKEQTGDVSELIRRLIKRGEQVCLEQEPSDYTEFIFAPSIDMGPYISCADVPPIHGLFYSCEPEFMNEPPEQTERTRRLARIYKALGDEQRLRIFQMLHEQEMYAREIVERTGLHQSVVSRHLSFMVAVGLLEWRREGNMKFFSTKSDLQSEMQGALAMLGAAVQG